jgi:uncharacterized RDD family membrane protein YckC
MVVSNENNPFETPEVEGHVDPDAGANYLDATRGLRFANFIIDYVACTIFSGLVGAILGMAGAVALTEDLPGMLLGVMASISYYVLMEGLTGRTLGKYVTGTKVVGLANQRVGWGAVIGRSFARFVPFEPLSFLGENAGWHDDWTNTRVVKVRGHAA